MDPFDESILRTLRGRAPMDLQQIKDEVGFPRNTVRLHLNNLVERGLITREKTPSVGPGRPKFTYHMPKRPGRRASAPLTGPPERVTLPFPSLGRLCRNQRGGRCRETKDRCEAIICPQIKKGE